MGTLRHRKINGSLSEGEKDFGWNADRLEYPSGDGRELPEAAGSNLLWLVGDTTRQEG